MTLCSTSHAGRILPLLAAVTLLGLAVPGTPNAATIHGTVRNVPEAKEVRAANAYPGRAVHSTDSQRNQPARAQESDSASRFADVVIYLNEVANSETDGTGTSKRTKTRNAQTNQLAQMDKAFVPRVLPIVAGETVDFPNFDPYYHNVFSFSPARRFDLGKYSEGKSKTIDFDKPGEVHVFCDIHSDMHAVILVLANSYFTQPKEDGSYEMHSVPPGDYELVLWHPDSAPVFHDIRLAPGPSNGAPNGASPQTASTVLELDLAF